MFTLLYKIYIINFNYSFMFTIIFDTYSGLCNQMYDIHSGVNFCITYNIPFTFRFASFRSSTDLCKWFNVEFTELFDTDFLSEIDLYKPYDTLDCNIKNTYNYNNDYRSIEWIDTERAIFPQLDRIQKRYIVLRQFWSIPCNITDSIFIYPILTPCEKLMRIFKRITQSLPPKYNLIHYRYEDDFNTHFKIVNPLKLCDIISHVKFKDENIPTYIAANNVHKIPKSLLPVPIDTMENIIYKSKDMVDKLNFEEAAFVDYMIGKNAVEFYGHHNSSFSTLINSSHCTNNYYDLEMNAHIIK